MQFFLDSADPAELREALSWRVVDGVTTNPALLAQQGGDSRELLAELCELSSGPVFVSVTSNEIAAMVSEAQSLASSHEKIVVRVPCIPAGIPAIASLAEARVSVDATLCYSVNQALMAAKAGARFVSPQISGLDGAGQDGLAVMGTVIATYDQYNIKTRVLADGVRHPNHVAEAARMGADAASMPLELLRGLAEHPLSERAHRDFLESWRRAQN